MSRLLAAALVLVVGVGCKAAVDRSDGKVPQLQVPRVARQISIDGKLEEWREAAGTGAFVAPGSGKLRRGSPVAGEALLYYDDAHLYVAFRVADRAPSSPFSRDDVDPHIWARASGVELMIQPGDFGDNRDYFEVQVDTNLAVWDTRFSHYNRPISRGHGKKTRYGHQGWKSGVKRAAHIDKGRGYALELALPWRSFAIGRGAEVSLPPKKGDIWRANFYSFRDGQRHAAAWSPLLGKGNFHKASRFGRLRF